MKSLRSAVFVAAVLLFPLLITVVFAANDKKFSCAESDPQSICSAATTCGSPTAPCKVDIKREAANSATATPEIPNGKGNNPFCVKVGTSITFYTTSKDTGFVIDFGPNSPFDPKGTIMGGADRPVTVVAKKADATSTPSAPAQPAERMVCAVIPIPNWL
jgi:hypothetical protein